MYRLVITKYGKNELYDDQLSEYSNRSKFDNYGMSVMPSPPLKYVEETKLEVELTDEEYKLVKQAVIIYWKQ